MGRRGSACCSTTRCSSKLSRIVSYLYTIQLRDGRIEHSPCGFNHASSAHGKVSLLIVAYRELRNSVDTLRLETDKQASFHLQLSQQIRNDLEGQTAAFSAKQQHHKKTYQAAIEKEFKVKQTREQHAAKAREKYEADCVRINSYTAQSTLVQGKDLEKIHMRLERAQQTVQVNENDYAQFTRVLQETMQKWEQDWKSFCDSCQDLEEERMEFMKDNMWAYANSVSTVCVSDDEVSLHIISDHCLVICH
jgi:hypothetical protein